MTASSSLCSLTHVARPVDTPVTVITVERAARANGTRLQSRSGYPPGSQVQRAAPQLGVAPDVGLEALGVDRGTALDRLRGAGGANKVERRLDPRPNHPVGLAEGEHRQQRRVGADRQQGRAGREVEPAAQEQSAARRQTRSSS